MSGRREVASVCEKALNAPIIFAQRANGGVGSDVFSTGAQNPRTVQLEPETVALSMRLAMKTAAIDRSTLLHNLRKSRLLSKQNLRVVTEKLGHIRDAREIAKALATW